MSDADEVRAMDIATKLLDHLLSWATTESINSIGAAIVDLALQCDCVVEIHAVGDLLESLTERDRKAIARGERWSKGSRALSQEEGQKVLRGMTLDQLDAFAERWGYGQEVMDWARGYSDIHGGALVALGYQDEMDKITGGER
jgi:hypothetical protein